jgi:hypothetical protein
MDHSNIAKVLDAGTTGRSSNQGASARVSDFVLRISARDPATAGLRSILLLILLRRLLFLSLQDLAIGVHLDLG